MADTLTKNFSLIKIEPGSLPFEPKQAENFDRIDELIAGRTSDKTQVVVSGKVNASNNPNYLSVSGGLIVQIDAAATNLIMNFSDGPNRHQSVLSNDQFIVGIPDDTFGELYAEYNVATKLVTYGVYSQPNVGGSGFTVYSKVAPASPATEDMWFDTVGMKIYKWDGFSWINVVRLIIGTYNVVGGVFVNLSPVAFNGVYISSRFSIVGNTSYSLSHNLVEGSGNLKAVAYGYVVIGSTSDVEFESTYNTNGAYISALQRLFVSLTTFTTPSLKNATRQTAAYAQIIVERIW